ncbi:histone-lysine N-methyltransferase SETMAR [Plakobranchus ocellatus]|uniref:Histone-lysine N-methyltransferase SETMAR n=1 Tax=Plakobranchus ocellatus TaxID=259542 RepID=A0AAV4CCR4_9GAST|nr:histone-lysine N-methyltransferase SETMAR [Plakobranchus ocellatus]
MQCCVEFSSAKLYKSCRSLLYCQLKYRHLALRREKKIRRRAKRKEAEAICRKRPGLLRRGVVLQHDNATPHSANLTQQWLQRDGWEILPHPAHSPDLAPSDFHFFGPLKRHLGGVAFETEDDLISELRNWFDNLDVDFFRVGIDSLLSR